MTDEQFPDLTRRLMIGGAGVALAAAPTPALAKAAEPQAALPLQNPVDEYPKPPFDKQQQPWSGLASRMNPAPDHGERS